MKHPLIPPVADMDAYFLSPPAEERAFDMDRDAREQIEAAGPLDDDMPDFDMGDDQ